jgi:hypothetical protein
VPVVAVGLRRKSARNVCVEEPVLRISGAENHVIGAALPARGGRALARAVLDEPA